MNTPSFIENAYQVHGIKYDYSRSVYSRPNDFIEIVCPIHGKFNQKAYYHLKGSGCQECGSHKSPPNKKTREQFIEEAIKFHGEKFDYSEVVYIDAKTKVKIKCKLHGMFEQIPYGHFKGTGCKKCKYESITNAKQKPLSEFIERATKAHGDFYEYSKVEFSTFKGLITIICKIHGEFKQKASDHILGKGCKKCGNVYKPITEEWVKLAKEKHGDKYDYSKTIYKNAYSCLTIVCKDHGEFRLTPASHLGKSHGCKKCSNRIRYTTEEWKLAANNIHGDIYDYSKVSFTRGIDEVVIICKVHGEFCQQANLHLMGSGCTLCKNKTESKLFSWLKENYPSTLSQKTFDWCISDETGAKYRYDFYIPEIQTIVELDGDQHFREVWKWGDPEITRQRDVWKMKKAIDNGLRIIRLLQEDLRCRNSKWLDKELKPLLEIKEMKSLTDYLVTERFIDRYDKHKALYDKICKESIITHV